MFVNLATSITQKTFTYATGLSAGGTYAFKVMAKNSVGYSPLSVALSILVAQVPTATVAPTTSVSGANVLINWDVPYTGATRITSYTITVRASNGTYLSDITNCNGANVMVVASHSCSIPTSVLMSIPFNLQYGNSVFA